MLMNSLDDEVDFEDAVKYALESTAIKKAIGDKELPYEVDASIRTFPGANERPYWLDDYEKERYTGKMVYALVREPRSCAFCTFGHCSWSVPWWGTPGGFASGHDQPSTVGRTCTLAHNNIIMVSDIDDKTYKPNWCPLIQIEEECDD